MKNRKKIVFRADGDSAIGMGHFVRSLALADMVRGVGETIFCTCNPNEYQREQILDVCDNIKVLPSGNPHFEAFLNFLEGDETVVLDNYFFDTDYQRAIKSKGCRLICIDDMHDNHYVADIVVNHALGLSENMFSTEPYTQLCLGLDWALLRKPFFYSFSQRVDYKVDTVFVCFGGVDFFNLSMRTVAVCLNIPQITKINVVVGSSFKFIDSIYREYEENERVNIGLNLSAKELRDMMSESDFAIVPASTVLWEALAVGLPCVYGFYVDNQRDIEANIGDDESLGLISVGDYNEVTDSDLQFKIETLISKVHSSLNKINIKNVPLNFKKLFMSEITVRSATTADADMFFDWANDPETRANSCSTDSINYENHVAWFNFSLSNANRKMYVCYYHDKPLGQIRFDTEGDHSVISISLDKVFRGRGLGVDMLQTTIDVFLRENPKNLVAYVKHTNVPSQKMFEKLSFVRVEHTDPNILKYKYDVL